MDARNCKKCGRMYAYNGLKYCPKCQRAEEENYKKVKEYIYDNSDATIQETSEATDVSVRKIISYLRQGRLEIKGENTNMVLDCERCGASIKTGRYCNNCSKELEQGFRSGGRSDNNKKSSRSKDKMYVADRLKR